MAWEPQEDGLRQILQLLKESQSTNNETQKAVQMVCGIATHVHSHTHKQINEFKKFTWQHSEMCEIMCTDQICT